MKKLLIHIGYPKTATKTLQLNVLTQLHKANKIEFLNHFARNIEGVGNIPVHKTLSFVLGLNTKVNYRDELNRLKDIDTPLSVISNESIAHVSKYYPKPTLRRGALENAKKIKNLLSPHFDVTEIVMTIRAQESIIPSYYTQEYYNIINDNPEFQNFALWIDRNFNKKISKSDLLFNYEAMFSAYEECFRRENIHVLIFEDSKKNISYYYKQWGRLLGTDSGKIQKYFEIEKQNVTKKKAGGGRQTDQATLNQIVKVKLNQLFHDDQEKSWFKAGKKIFKKIFPDRLLNFNMGNTVEIRNLNKQEINLIHQQFDESNILLAKKLKLDLSKMASYNYF